MKQSRLIELLHGGDWACAFGDRQTLELVCQALARESPADWAQRAQSVARLAGDKMPEAVRAWAQLGREVRAARLSASSAEVL